MLSEAKSAVAPSKEEGGGGQKGKIWILILVLFLAAAIGFGGYLVYKKYFQKAVKEELISQSPILKLDPEKEATHLSKVADTKGVYFARILEIFWNEVETKKGKFDWGMVDEMISEFNQAEIYPLAMVKPFANWDQESCHPERRYEAQAPIPGKAEAKIKVGKPCDMTAYAHFLKKAVERYDGDGIDDMPGLTIPVKYWEIMNEPEMQGGVTGGMGEELKFFVGSSQDYLEILKTSYKAIKEADPGAKVVQGGMAGMQQNFVDFWQPILSAGGGDYFDIANNHTISTDEKREDLFMIKFKKFLKKFGLENKPIWLTEVQFGRLAERPSDLKSFEILMAKASVFALVKGADKLFYIDNWLSFWDRKEKGKEEIEKEEKEGKKEKPEIPPEILTTSTHKAYLNLVNKINRFDKVEVIKEEYIENPSDNDGATSKIGQYKFVSDSKAIYVLWGKTTSPSEISGKIKVTDIYGDSTEMDAKNLILSGEPVFVEIL